MGLKIEYGNAGYIETDYDSSKSLLGHKEGSVGRLYDHRTSAYYPGPYNTGFGLSNILISFPFKYPLAQPGEDPWMWPFEEWVKIITPRQIHVSDFHAFHRLNYSDGNYGQFGGSNLLYTPFFGIDPETGENVCKASETKYLYKIIGPGKAGTVGEEKYKDITYTFTHPNCQKDTTAGSGSTFGTNPKIIRVFNTIEIENGMTVTGDGIPANTTVAEVLSSSLVRLNNDVTETTESLPNYYDQLTFSGPKRVLDTDNNPHWDKWQTSDISGAWIGSIAADKIDTRKSYHLYFSEDLYKVKVKVNLKSSITNAYNSFRNIYSQGATNTDFVANARRHSYTPGEYEIYGHQLFEGNLIPSGKLKNWIGDRGAWALYNPQYMIEQEHGTYSGNLDTIFNTTPNPGNYIKYLEYNPIRSSAYGETLDPASLTVGVSYDTGGEVGWIANWSNASVEDSLTHPTVPWNNISRFQPSGGATWNGSAWAGTITTLEPGRGYQIKANSAPLVNSAGDSIFPESVISGEDPRMQIQVWGDSSLIDPDTGLIYMPDFAPPPDWVLPEQSYNPCSPDMWFGDICEPAQNSTYPEGQGVKWYNLVIPNNSEGANWYPQPGQGNDTTGQDNPNFGKNYWTVICPTDYTTFPYDEVGGGGSPYHYAGFAPLDSWKWFAVIGGFNGELGHIQSQNSVAVPVTDGLHNHRATLRTTSTSGFYWMNALINAKEARPLLNQYNFQYHQYESFWAKYWYDPIRQDHFTSMGGRIGLHQWNRMTKEDHLDYMAQYGGGTLGNPSTSLGFWEEEILHPLIDEGSGYGHGIVSGGDKIHWKARERQHQLGMQRGFHGPYGQMPEWQDDFNGFTMENWGRECTGVSRKEEGIGTTQGLRDWIEDGNPTTTQYISRNSLNDDIPIHRYPPTSRYWNDGTTYHDHYIDGKNATTGNMWDKFKHNPAYKKQWPERAPGFDKSNPADGSYHLTDAASNTGDKISGYSMPFTWILWNGSTCRFYKVRPVIVRWKNCYDDGVPINNPAERMCFYYYADNHRIYMNDLRNRTTTSAHEANYPSQEFWYDGSYYDGSDNLTQNNGLNHGPSVGKLDGMGDTPCSHVGSFMDYACPSVIKHGTDSTQSFYEDYPTSGNGATYSDHYTIDGIESGSRDAQLNFYCGKYVREGHAKNGTIQPVNDKTSAYISKITLLDGTETYQYTHRHYMMIQDGTSITFNTAMETSGPFERDKNLETESGE